MFNRVVLALVLTATIALAIFAIRSQTRPRRTDVVLPDSTQGEGSPRAVRLGSPRPIVGTETMFLPIQYGSGFEQSTVYGSSGYAAEPMVNVVFLTANDTHLLLDRPARIGSALLPDSLVSPPRDWIAYDLAFEDTNEDGLLNQDDGRTLALSTSQGRDFRVILPANMYLHTYHVVAPDTILVYAFSEPPPRRGRPDERRQTVYLYSVHTSAFTALEDVNDLLARASQVLAK